MDTQIDLFLTSIQTFWGQIGLFLPKLLAAIVLLFAGWLIARLLRTGVQRGLDALGFGRLAEKSGLEAILRQGNIDVSLRRDCRPDLLDGDSGCCHFCRQ